MKRLKLKPNQRKSLKRRRNLKFEPVAVLIGYTPPQGRKLRKQSNVS